MPSYAWPSTATPSRIRVYLAPASVIIPSVRNPAIATVYELPIQVWKCDYSFDMINQSKKRTLQGFLPRLNGASGSVLVTDPDYEYDTITRRLGGNPTGTMTASGAKDSQTLSIAGITGGSFKAGDRFAAGGFVYQVVADVSPVGGAIASMEVRPRLRGDLAANAVTLTNLQWTMRLVDDKQILGLINAAGNVEPGTTISFVEIIL